MFLWQASRGSWLSVCAPCTKVVLRALNVSARHPTGSQALDVLTQGGYHAGSIVELQAADTGPCWQVAWLAVAAAQLRGEPVFVCGSKAFTDFGAGLGLVQRSDVATTRVLQPDVLMAAVASLRAQSSLMIVESVHAVAEAAAEPGPDPATTASVRNRRLSRFLRQLSLTLQKPLPQRQRLPRRLPPEPASTPRAFQSSAWFQLAGGGSDSTQAEDAGQPNQRLSSVLFCNPHSGSQVLADLRLQQYATQRLRLNTARGSEAVEGRPADEISHLVAQLLKAPSLTSRMPTPVTELFIPTSESGIRAMVRGEGLHSVLDLVAAAGQLGLVTYRAGDGGQEEAGGGGDGRVCYRDWEAASLRELASIIAASQTAMLALTQEVAARAQQWQPDEEALPLP